MSEENVQETETQRAEETIVSEDNASETQDEGRPNAYAFASYLFGGWAALMIALTLIAVVAMEVVGMMAG